MSQMVFAERGGVTKKTQMLYEGGERFPDAQYLASIAETGVDVLYVLTGRRTVSYQPAADRHGGNVMPLYAGESAGMTQRHVLEMVLDALHQLGKTLPAKAVFGVVDAVMALQRAGATVNKSTIQTQLRLVK